MNIKRKLLAGLMAACMAAGMAGCGSESAGGGRFDAGMLCYFPQIWCSDNTDAVERLVIQHGTSFGYPVSCMGAHVSACPNHQTGRTTPLWTRAVVAMLYSVSTMVNLWSALAARDVRLLKAQLDALNALGPQCRFVNYLRCHDDIGWGLDEDTERYLGIAPQLHKEFLYHFYEGRFDGSWAKGEVYNYDPVTRDARSCGTAADVRDLWLQPYEMRVLVNE